MPKNGPLKIEHLESARFLDAFVKEVLRLYPPIGLIVRHCGDRPQKLGGESFIVPSRTKIEIPIDLLHRHPKYWKEPHRFDPTRFLESTPRPAYMPFSLFARSCIGQKFALFEAKLALAEMVHAFRFKFVPSSAAEHIDDVERARLIVTMPKPKLCVKIENRR